METENYNIIKMKYALYKPQLLNFYKSNIKFHVMSTPGYNNNCALYCILLNLIFQSEKCLAWNEEDKLHITNKSIHFASDEYLHIMCKMMRQLINLPGHQFISDDQLEYLAKTIGFGMIIIEYDISQPTIIRSINVDEPLPVVYLAFDRSPNCNHWEHVLCDATLPDLLKINGQL